VVSLYVNDYNHAAVGTYLKVGLSIVGTFATVLF
jgi:predicted GNAT family acetyltransferase